MRARHRLAKLLLRGVASHGSLSNGELIAIIAVALIVLLSVEKEREVRFRAAANAAMSDKL